MSFVFLSLESEILAIDFEVPGNVSFSLLNTYFPYGVTCTGSSDAALAAFQNDVILAGDFNSHHVDWSFRSDACGRRLWEWVSDHSLSCQKLRTPTCLRGQSKSVLDLTFAKPGLVVVWSTVECATYSDHIPVVFDIRAKKNVARRAHAFVDMSRYGNIVRSALPSIPPQENEHPARELVSLLQDSATRAKFTISSVQGKACSPWWNEECTRNFRRRKAAWKKLRHNQCPENWSNFKYFRAVFKRTVARGK